MQTILKIIRNSWFISILGLIAIAAIIWFIGPLIAIAGQEPFVPALNRFIAIGVVLLIWGLIKLKQYISALKKNQQMLESVATPAEEIDTAGQESAEELELLQRRLNDAMEILKESKLGKKHKRQYIYQLPWYMLIGPPGSGKTTALLNSGLNFPLADKLGKNAIAGVGGTRNCDWWFTDDAVLLDTAGRYTTQDSYAEVDRAAWTGFLDMLKKNRKRRPINGALIAISVEDILQYSDMERQNHASAIRKRIQELHDHFGIRFPIYVLFTKVDLLAGFNEFYENLGRDERNQVWGMTFPVTEKDDKNGATALFTEEFKALEKRVEERLLERLDQERDNKRRILIYSFPQQFSALRHAAELFLKEAFDPNRFEETPMIRGIYFTSGTQEGTPIDRLLGSMAKGFGLNRQIAPSFSGSGRSYFLQNLLTKVVFPEAHLAGINAKQEQKMAWFQRLAYAGAISVAVAAGAAWFTSYSRNQSFIDLVAVKAQEAEQQVEAVAPTDLTLVGVINALDTIRRIPGGYEDQEAPIPLLMRLGLYQGDKLGEQAQFAYSNALKNLFLPRIVLRLEDQLRERNTNTDFTYEALKVYLMLDDREHFDADTLKAWMLLDWEINLAGADNAQTRQALTSHLDALIEQMPMALTLPLDQTLIARVRNNLLRAPLANRVYNRIKLAPQVRSALPFRLGDALGPDATLVFDRKSGKSLDEDIPALFTYQGYHKLFLKEHLDIAGNLLEERWILGPELEQTEGKVDLVKLSGNVKRLYYKEYIDIWEGLLSDLRVAPFKDVTQAVEILNILSGPNSLLRRLLRIVEQETTLMRLPAGTENAAKEVARRNSNLTGKLANILRVAPKTEDGAGKKSLLSTPVDQHFAALHKSIRSRGSEPAPLERPIGMLNELYAHMSAISSAVNQSTRAFDSARNQTADSSNVISRIKLEAKRQPGPVAKMLNAVAGDSSNLTASGVREHLNTLWQSKVLAFYQRSLHKRYPLDRKSAREATISDFGKFFGPGGLMDEFFTNNLQDFVDTSGRIWRWTAPGSKELGIPPGTLRQFQRAATIRDAFFGEGGLQPKIHFDVRPLNMDTTISQLTLLLDDQNIGYSHGPTRWRRLNWPSAVGGSQAKILFSPPAGSSPSGISEDGPWGWFRLIDKTKTSLTDTPETIKVKFSIGGRNAQFMIRASGVLNPFQLKELGDFRCPSRL